MSDKTAGPYIDGDFVNLPLTDDERLLARAASLVDIRLLAGAPEAVAPSVARDLADYSEPTADFPEPTTEYITALRRKGRWGEVKRRELVWRPFPAVIAGIDVPAGQLTATYSVTRGRKAGVSLKVFGVGLDHSYTYEVTRTQIIEVREREAKQGFWLVPMHRVVRMWQPAEGSESFPVVRWEPARDRDVGVRQETVDLSSVETDLFKPYVAIDGNRNVRGATEATISISNAVSLGQSDEHAEFSVSVEASGSITVGSEWSVPPGSYSEQWTKRPVGFLLRRAEFSVE